MQRENLGIIGLSKDELAMVHLLVETLREEPDRFGEIMEVLAPDFFRDAVIRTRKPASPRASLKTSVDKKSMRATQSS